MDVYIGLMKSQCLVTIDLLCCINSLYVCMYVWLAVWLSDNALASINVVALRQTRLVLGWVTICERVNHLGM